MRIDPAVGVISPSSIWIVVVLPAPFGPKRPRISPGWISNDTPSTAVNSPNRFVRPRTSTIGSDIEGLGRGLVEKIAGDFLWQMAGLAPFVEHLPLVRGFAIVTSEAMRQRRRTELGPFRVIRILEFAGLGHMPACWADRAASA